MCATVLERYVMCWIWRLFSYSTAACVSALRNFSLLLLLRIHQLVLFFYLFCLKPVWKKKDAEEGDRIENPYFFYNMLNYFISLYYDSLKSVSV